MTHGMQTPNLFDLPRTLGPAARSTDPATSHEAADKVTRTGTRAAQAAYVAGLVRQTPGLTSAELAERHGADRYMVARRLPDAAKLGLGVKRGPSRPCRTTGNAAMTWWPADAPE